ncbi:hypothetical protein [Brevundimonas sp.]
MAPSLALLLLLAVLCACSLLWLMFAERLGLKWPMRRRRRRRSRDDML